MDKIPCIKDKCILYATCKRKAVVRCELLFNWIVRHGHSNETWLYISQFLTEIYALRADRSWFNNDYEWPEKYYINLNTTGEDLGGLKNLSR